MSKPLNTLIQISPEKRVWRRIWVFFVLLTAIPASGTNQSSRFEEQVNLALRRTAHQLLMENGDTLSKIPPVEQSDAAVFSIPIDSLFDYDKLPQILQESLKLYGISQAYEVAIINCGDRKIQLGYSYLDLVAGSSVPCKGRQREAGCYLLKVSFLPVEAEPVADRKRWLVFIGFLLAGLGFIIWRKSRKDPIFPEQDASTATPIHRIKFGNATLDLSNLHLQTGNQIFNLTYREAKLLNLFATHQNEILERDFILKSVWEDEGVIVGRSIDVFVSRLRKLLREDATIKIAAVHGIGYRMEITG